MLLQSTDTWGVQYAPVLLMVMQILNLDYKLGLQCS